MSKKYNCKLCNYHTDNLCNFNKHKQTKKHMKNKININRIKKYDTSIKNYDTRIKKYEKKSKLA